MSTTTFIQRASLAAGTFVLVLSLGACTKPNSNPAPAGSSSAAVSGSGARIELLEKEHDFGNVTEGDSLKHTFKVKNAGTAPLEITRVRTSCGCTAAVTKEKTVAPGQTTEIEVTFNTRGRMGPNRKTITIQTNDPENANAKVEIKAMIERLLAFEPTIVRLNASHGEEKSVEAWLTGKLAKDAKLEIGEVEGDSDVKVELAEKKEGEETKRGVKFTLKGTKVGRTNGTVKIKTGVEKVPELSLRFNTAVTGNVDVRPRALYFDDKTPQGKERVMRVTSKREDFKLTAAKVLEGPYKARISKPETGAGFDVHVTYEGKGDGTDKDPNASNGKLELVSNDPLEPKIEVPLNLRRLPNLVRPRPGVQIRRPGEKPAPPAPKPE